jgi:hypothetical protein
MLTRRKALLVNSGVHAVMSETRISPGRPAVSSGGKKWRLGVEFDRAVSSKETAPGRERTHYSVLIRGTGRGLRCWSCITAPSFGCYR